MGPRTTLDGGPTESEASWIQQRTKNLNFMDNEYI